jgi:hypothetical protein
VDEYIPSKRPFGDGVQYRKKRPILFRVIGTEQVEQTYMDAGIGQRRKVMEQRPIVKYHPFVRRRQYFTPVERVKIPINLLLKSSEFIRVPMPPSLAEQILDDREWKKDHKWAVPLMVDYQHILSAVKAGIDGTVIKWDNYDE